MSLSVDITKRYKNYSLSVKFETADDTLGIIGASGAGKSLILKSIAGVVTPDSGHIILNGKTLFDSENRINLPPQKRKVGYLFQSYALFPNMTVEQNIMTGMTGNRSQKQIKVKEIVETFCIKGLEKMYPGQLSGGQQQRVALARIIASEAEVLLLDEPFSALDYYLKEQLQEQLLEIIRNYKKDVMMVTHDRDEAFRFCSKLVIIDHGQLVCEGNLKDIFKNPKYLVAARLMGCKNISKATKLSEHEVYADDWKLKLQVEQPIPDKLAYVGIRAHNLKAVVDCKEQQPNTFEPELVEIIEDSFEITIVMRNRDNLEKAADDKILWRMSKEKWYDVLQEQLPTTMLLPTTSILLLQ